MFCTIHRKLVVIGPGSNKKTDPEGHYPPNTNSHCPILNCFHSTLHCSSVEFLPCHFLELIYFGYIKDWDVPINFFNYNKHCSEYNYT